MMQNITSFLKEKESEMLETLKCLVEMESPSLKKDLTDKIGNRIAEVFEELTGGSTTVIPNDVYGNHIRGEWGSGDEQILLLAHFDTVWPEGQITRMPFQIKAGKAYGPGVFDMKGGLVQGIYALYALSKLNLKTGKKVVFLFTSDEEIGSLTSGKLIEKEAKKSKYVFVLEPAMSVQGALKTTRKGIGIIRLEVFGKAAHAGIEPEKGNSAIAELAHQITYLQSLTDYDLGTTINVGTIKGGTHSNVVSSYAEACIEVRVKTQIEFNRIIPLIENIAPKTEGVSLKVTSGIESYPLERTKQVEQLFLTAKQIAKDHLKFELQEKATGGGSDGNRTAPITPTLDGLGAVGDGAHAEHEHLVISEMPVRSALVAMLIEELLQE